MSARRLPDVSPHPRSASGDGDLRIGSPIHWGDGPLWEIRISSRPDLYCLVCNSLIPAGTQWLMLLQEMPLRWSCFPCYEDDVLGLVTCPTGQLKMVESSMPDENMARSIKLSVQYHCIKDMPDYVSEASTAYLPEEEMDPGPAKVIGDIHIYIYICAYIFTCVYIYIYIYI
jgi:hypothetical protein